MVDKVKDCEGKLFLIDINILYIGSRINFVDYFIIVIENGFVYVVVNVLVIIVDGLYSRNYENVKIDKKYFESVKIGGEIYNFFVMIVMSYFKGYEVVGFGGVLKNLVMGCVSVVGK